jgi:ketosteroid isomerase-like protein
MTDKVAIIRSQVDAFKRGDREFMRRNLADDLIWYSQEGNPTIGGVMHGPDEFLDMAFKYQTLVKKVKIHDEIFMTDGDIVLGRQFEEVTRNDGTVVNYVFLKCYEFNDKNQIRRCWEVTNSDFSKFP